MNIYKQFANYVIQSFFTDERKDEFIFLIIDNQYIESIANKMRLSKDNLIRGLQHIFYYKTSFYEDNAAVISMISLQLYAASECQSDEYYTYSAYNPRLCEILDCDINELQIWYRDYQEIVWRLFYKWCESNTFKIHRCMPRSGKNKFVQYPQSLANYCLNREDFKYIVSVFNEKKIQPYEYILYDDFWNIVNINSDFYKLNKHIQLIFDSILRDTKELEPIKNQIFNYFLSWDGTNILSLDPEYNSSTEIFKIYLSNKSDEYKLDVRREDGSRITSFPIHSFTEISKYYSYKRSNIIIFQQDRDGDPYYWDEVRFIESKEEAGLAIVLNNFYNNQFNDDVRLFISKDLAIYKFKFNNKTKEFYSNSKPYFEIIGGLKLAHMTYLAEGEPILRLHKDCTFLLNREVQTKAKGDIMLSLEIGLHSFKFPKNKEFKLKIVPKSNRSTEWNEDFFNWNISQWRPNTNDKGAVGTDFRIYSIPNEVKSMLKQWALTHRGIRVNAKKNISLTLLNNINTHD